MAKTTRKAKNPARPIDPAVMAQANDIAAKYEIVLWQDEGHWYGRGVEYPHAMGDGQTPDGCYTSTRAAIALAVAVEIEAGIAPAVPASKEERTEQVNIRLTPRERLQIESRANQSGFVGMADYMRASALAEKISSK